MPKYFRTILLCIGTFSLIVLHPSRIYSATDPIPATVSATANVPETPPSTTDDLGPTPPILIAPADGSSTGDNTPEFVWTRSTDPNGNTVLYTLYLNGIATYLGISNIGNSATNNYTSRIDGNEVKLIPTIDLPDGVYNWYVTAQDPSGNVTNSATWNLTIDTTPPFIAVNDVDSYHPTGLDSDHPENFEGLNFEIAGPKDIYITLHTEPWSTVTLQFVDSTGSLVTQSSWPVDRSGVIHPYAHLEIGVYTVYIVGYDGGANTTALPSFLLTIYTPQISIPLPPIPGLEPTLDIPYKPISIPSLPATVSQVTSRSDMSVLLYASLAVIVYILLLLIWKRKYNLVLIDGSGNPHINTTIYHSIPTSKSKSLQILVSSRDPISYLLDASDYGRLYVKHLSRYSTLTIRTQTATHILSISAKRKQYTIII